MFREERERRGRFGRNLSPKTREREREGEEKSYLFLKDLNL
jgi:hypothetical protein